MNQEQPTERWDCPEEQTTPPVSEREVAKAYCKPELKRLGVLASVAGSGPSSPGAFWEPLLPLP